MPTCWVAALAVAVDIRAPLAGSTSASEGARGFAASRCSAEPTRGGQDTVQCFTALAVYGVKLHSKHTMDSASCRSQQDYIYIQQRRFRLRRTRTLLVDKCGCHAPSVSKSLSAARSPPCVGSANNSSWMASPRPRLHPRPLAKAPPPWCTRHGSHASSRGDTIARQQPRAGSRARRPRQDVRGANRLLEAIKAKISSGTGSAERSWNGEAAVYQAGRKSR